MHGENSDVSVGPGSRANKPRACVTDDLRLMSPLPSLHTGHCRDKATLGSDWRPLSRWPGRLPSGPARLRCPTSDGQLVKLATTVARRALDEVGAKRALHAPDAATPAALPGWTRDTVCVSDLQCPRQPSEQALNPVCLTPSRMGSNGRPITPGNEVRQCPSSDRRRRRTFVT
jgi:hypothetical protein